MCKDLTLFFVFLKVHKLDPEQWKKVEVVHIDIADRSQVDTKVRKTECLLSTHDQTLRLADCFKHLHRTTNQTRIQPHLNHRRLVEGH